MKREQIKAHIGLRIRSIREQQRLSLRALAERSGLSINAISQIERGEVSPTLSSIDRLAAALDIHIADLFEKDKGSTTLFVKKHDGLILQENGIVIESLGFGLHNQQFEPFRMTIQAGAKASKTPLIHTGQEFIYCLEGELECFIGSEMYHMEAGDCLLFEARQPHNWRNPSRDQVSKLLILQTNRNPHFTSRLHPEE